MAQTILTSETGKAQERNCSQQTRNVGTRKPTRYPAFRSAVEAGRGNKQRLLEFRQKGSLPEPAGDGEPGCCYPEGSVEVCDEAVRQMVYSHAWGTAILAGAAFFALGWIVKGGNPLPSLSTPKHDLDDKKHPSSSDH